MLLLIAALALPAAASARERGFGAPGWGGERPGAPWGDGRPQPMRPYDSYGGPANFGGDRPRAGRPPGPVYRDLPPYGGYGHPPAFNRPRLRSPDDWNDYGMSRGEVSGWRRGQVFPQGARGAIVGDYGRYHLRRPPPGYYWYRNGDDFILAAIASGLIFEVVPDDGY